MRTGWPTTAMPKPNFLSERVFSRSMVVMRWPVLMWLVTGWDPKFCGWLWDGARWGNVVSCKMSCHVMWSDVFSFYAMRFLVLCDFTWCTAMSCDVLSCDGLSSVVKWCGAMGWDLMSLWWDVAGCDVTLCGSKWLCGVNWKMIWWSVLHRSTPYYTVTPVLHSTTFVLQSTTPYYSSTSLYYKVLLQYYKVLLQYYSTLYYNCSTKYCSSTTLYYKVLLQYYSVLSPLKFPAQNGWARARHKPSFCAGQWFAQKMALGSLIL